MVWGAVLRMRRDKGKEIGAGDGGLGGGERNIGTEIDERLAERFSWRRESTHMSQ